MKITLLKTIILAVSAFGIATSPAATILFTDTLPTSDVTLSNTSSGGTSNRQFYNMNGSSTPINRWVGVGFSASTDTTLDKMTFFIYNSTVGTSVPNAAMTISVVALSSLTAAPATPYTVLYSETALVPSTYSGQSYITFDLNTPFELTAGSNYGIVLSFNDTSAGTTRYINLSMNSTSVGINNIGKEYYSNNQGSSWTVDSASLNFVLQSVPEPSSVVLIGFSSLLIGGVFMRSHSRRRNNQLATP